VTKQQILIVASIGGFAAAITLILVVVLALAVHRAVHRLLDLHDAYRERRAHAREQQQRENLGIFTRTQHAIDTLPTTRHPTEN
jgi:heme exporter protein D